MNNDENNKEDKLIIHVEVYHKKFDEPFKTGTEVLTDMLETPGVFDWAMDNVVYDIKKELKEKGMNIAEQGDEN